VGFSVYSQNDEDGILWYIFSLAGTTDKRLVDIGCGGVQDSNTANLIIAHGWSGLLIDGDRRMVRAGRRFYSTWRDTRQSPPLLVHAFVSAENVNQLLIDQGTTGDIDLLSIDLDGIDYWIWKAIDCVRPRVVVLEFQAIIGPDRAITVPYRPDFRIGDYVVNKNAANYAGASLAAFVKLGKAKGYRLVGCNRPGYNAFFLRSDVGADCLPEVPAAACFRHPERDAEANERWYSVNEMEWVEV
jgi:hypothetical protein